MKDSQEREAVSERDAVLRERQAFERGYRTRPSELRDGANALGRMLLDWERDAMDLAFRDQYPLPTITRPRVVKDPHNHEPHWGKPREWSCFDGQLYSRTIGLRPGYDAPTSFTWTPFAQIPPTPQRVKMWADLLANPTETVEAE